jgi:cytochrome P450 family 110
MQSTEINSTNNHVPSLQNSGISLLKLTFDPLSFYEQMARQYGDFFRLGKNSSIIYISHPQAIQEIFTADSRLFESGNGNPLRPLFGDNSVFLLDGQRHTRQRSLLLPKFHGEALRNYSEIIWKITDEIINQWEIGEPFPIIRDTETISLQVILNIVFGLFSGERYHQLRQLFLDLTKFFNSSLSFTFLVLPHLQKDWTHLSPWGFFLNLKKQIDRLLYAEIQERRESADSERKDILSLLLSAHDEEGQFMTDEEIRDELITLLIGGYATTASSLAWALYWIDYSPGVREKLCEELDCFTTEDNLMALTKLPYLNALCSETLRIYPPFTTTFRRLAESPLEVMGYRFEPGTVLAISIYLAHHREDIYLHPKQYRPERFLEKQFSQYEYLPFGGGNRRCIGQALTLLEMKLVIANIMLRWKLALVHKRSIKPVRLGVSMAPPRSLMMVPSDLAPFSTGG